jgi:O-methyltransferase
MDIISVCKEYSMISTERFLNNIKSVEYILDSNIPGDIVEIGVYKGGSILSMMLTCEKYEKSRTFHLYDTFEGMTPPTNEDVDFNNQDSQKLMDQNPFFKCICNYEEVKKNIEKHTSIRPQYHIGDILKNTFYPEQIALLRLDTDWYESTKFELENFYDKVSVGGIVIVDDYGHWKGCKKAVDEFLSVHPEIKIEKIDYTGIYFKKVECR